MTKFSDELKNLNSKKFQTHFHDYSQIYNHNQNKENKESINNQILNHSKEIKNIVNIKDKNTIIDN